MSFTRDDVVMHNKMGIIGVVIGAGIKLDGEVIYLIEVPGRGAFTHFLGTEDQLTSYQIEDAPLKLARVDYPAGWYSHTSFRK